MPPTIIYEYKTVSIFPEGMRVKGDDVTEKLTDLLNTRCNEYAEDGAADGPASAALSASMPRADATA